MNYLSRNLLDTALGREPAETVIKGGRLLNVHTGQIAEGDVAISEGRIASVGDVGYSTGPETRVIDAEGKVLCPGLIEAHHHPETTKLTMTGFANAVVPLGTTSMITGFDYAAMVAGIDAIRWFVDDSKRTPLRVFLNSVTRIPYSRAGSSQGPKFGPEEHAIVHEWPETIGYWELCAPHVMQLQEDILQGAEIALGKGRLLSGDCGGVRGKELAAMVAIGMRDDHVFFTLDELVEKLSNGVYVTLIHLATFENVTLGVKAVTELGLASRYLILGNDDVDCLHLDEKGNIDHLIRLAINEGVDPIAAVQMGTLNAAECFRIDHLVGSITPGRFADILLLNDLESFEIDTVIVNGEVTARAGSMLHPVEPPVYPDFLFETLKVSRPFRPEDFHINVGGDGTRARVRVYEEDFSLDIPRYVIEREVEVVDGRLQADAEQDICYFTAVERHSEEGICSTVLASGIGIKRGAFATTLSGDNSPVVVGASTHDMAVALNHVIDAGGGQVVVEDGEVLAEIKLPIGGMLAEIPVGEMADKERLLNEAAAGLGVTLDHPFFSVLIAMIVEIQAYAITPSGLTNVNSGEILDLVLEIS